MNDVCGPYGKCVNLYYKSVCDCSVTIFYEGKYCDKRKPIFGNSGEKKNLKF